MCILLKRASTLILHFRIISNKLFLMLIYFWERDRDREWEGERQREKGRQRNWNGLYTDSRKPSAGLELMNCEIMTWAEVRCLTYWATQASLELLLCKIPTISIFCMQRDTILSNSAKTLNRGHGIVTGFIIIRVIISILAFISEWS